MKNLPTDPAEQAALINLCRRDDVMEATRKAHQALESALAAAGGVHLVQCAINVAKSTDPQAVIHALGEYQRAAENLEQVLQEEVTALPVNA